MHAHLPRASALKPDESVVSEARRLAEEKVNGGDAPAQALTRLRRLAESLDRPEQKIVVYLREAEVLRNSSLEEIASRYGDEVAEGLELITRQDGDSFADVVMRAAQIPLTYEIVANDIGEELDRIESEHRSSGRIEDGMAVRREHLILAQALLDNVRGGAGGPGNVAPVVIEREARKISVYLHPVHADVVVLVKDVPDGEEEWVLVNSADADRLLLESVADKLDRPLKQGLLPWLESLGIDHRYFKGSGEDGSGGALGA